MIIARCFPGDNIEVANYQYDVFGRALNIIGRCAISDYLEHARAIKLEDEITLFLSESFYFDYRPFQRFHDLLAAQYRYQYCMQLRLPLKEFSGPQIRDEWERHWLDYLWEELHRLIKHDFMIDLVYLLLLYQTDYCSVLEGRLIYKLADLYLNESGTREWKGINVFRAYYDEVRDLVINVDRLAREDVLKLVRENKALIESRIMRHE